MGSVQLLTEPQPWKADGRVRRAGVSSFGISGTNAHVIIEAAPAAESTASPSAVHSPVAPPPVVPWVLSAKSATALASQAARLADFVGAHAELTAADVGWSLAGRSTFEHRAVLLGADRDQLLAGLGELAGGEPSAAAITGQRHRGRQDRLRLPRPGLAMARHGHGSARRLPGLRRSLQHRGRLSWTATCCAPCAKSCGVTTKTC